MLHLVAAFNRSSGALKKRQLVLLSLSIVMHNSGRMCDHLTEKQSDDFLSIRRI